MKKQSLLVTCLSLMALALVMAVWNAKPAIAETGALDGKTFVGEVGEKGKNKGDKDELIFKDGKFRSTACDAYGFGDAVYTTTANGNSTTFETETFSAKEEKMKWSGTVKDDTLEGNVTWYKEGKEPKEYWFKSQLKK